MQLYTVMREYKLSEVILDKPKKPGFAGKVFRGFCMLGALKAGVGTAKATIEAIEWCPE